MTKRLCVLFVVMLAMVSGVVAPAYGWDSFGHMMVAYVAYQRLTPHAKLRANTLVRMNPKYDEWVAWVPVNASAADKDLMVFMIAATWPDEIKGDPSYHTVLEGRDDTSTDPHAERAGTHRAVPRRAQLNRSGRIEVLRSDVAAAPGRRRASTAPLRHPCEQHGVRW